MTHIQAYIPSRLAGLSGPHQKAALPDQNLPPTPHPKISTSLQRGSSTSDLKSPTATPPPPLLPSDDNRLEKTWP